MFPEEFIQRIQGQKYIDAGALFKALSEPQVPSIRINSSKWSRSPLNSDPVPWCSMGYYLHSRPSYTIDPLFHSGCYYPQEASGMFLEQAIRQTSESLDNIRVLDLCAAPGGKSTHISELIGKGSLLVANETIGSRAEILAETITKWGSMNTLVTRNDPAGFGKLPGFFDIILVDAPCSGEGMFRNKTAINEWSAENSAHCAVRQKRILSDIWPALKQNGILIYSTCTFNSAENEENIGSFIETNEAETVRLDISQFEGIIEIYYKGIYGYGFYPDKVRGEGFFLSVIRKTAKQEMIPVRTRLRSELRPDKSDLATTEKWTNFSPDRLLKWGNEIIVVPCIMENYLFLFQNLKIVKAGTKICVVKNRDKLPTYELALSQCLRNDIFPVKALNLQEAVGYLRRDNFVINDLPEGWNLVTYEGVNLGFVKRIGNRVNNYFPVEWRIRMDIPEPGKEKIIHWD